MIYGNIDGIKNTVLKKLDDLYEINIEKTYILNAEIAEILCRLTEILNREISVAVSRKGNVVAVSVGDSSTVEMPEISMKDNGLCGISIIHTHPNGNAKLSSIDLSALIKLKLDYICAIGVDRGEFNGVTVGICSIHEDNLVSEESKILTLKEAEELKIEQKIKDVEDILKSNEVIEDYGEKAILVGVDSEESLDELEELAKACDVSVAYKILQKRNKIDSAYYIGRGKVEEITLLRQAIYANVIIFDDELAASQVRNLEEYIGAKVIDRNTLILDIFAKRAKSRVGKIQVELAQLKYRLPRLTGLGTVLSRTGGGIGTRGPGEKKLEIDKRHIKERIYELTRELKKIKKVRQVQRSNRQSIPNISLVGYTNAGKSTLRNKLCHIASLNSNKKEDIFEADMLFATLDTTTRALELPDNEKVALTDTVGFIRKLPHELIEAFKSTLEEVIYSDLLLHVVDVSSPFVEEQINAVNSVLQELGCKEKTMIMVLNKIDKVSYETLDKVKKLIYEDNIVEVSAKTNKNLEKVLESISELLPYKLKKVSYVIPYDSQKMVAFLHRNSKVIKEEYKEMGTYIEAKVDKEVFNKCKMYLKEEL